MADNPSSFFIFAVKLRSNLIESSNFHLASTAVQYLLFLVFANPPWLNLFWNSVWEQSFMKCQVTAQCLQHCQYRMYYVSRCFICFMTTLLCPPNFTKSVTSLKVTPLLILIPPTLQWFTWQSCVHLGYH